jgi:hypothetical protein
VKLIALVFAAVAVGGSGDWHTVRDDGVSVRYPPSWFATTRRLTPVTYPRQVVAIASYVPDPRRPRSKATGETRARVLRILDSFVAKRR